MKILFENLNSKRFIIAVALFSSVSCGYVAIKAILVQKNSTAAASDSREGVAETDTAHVDWRNNKAAQAVDSTTVINNVPDFNQFDKVPNSPLWRSGHKTFTDNGKYWQLDVEVNGNNITIVTKPGANNTSHPNKQEVMSIEKGTIIDNTIYSYTSNGNKIKNNFRYLNGVFYEANNEGQYNEYKEVTPTETSKLNGYYSIENGFSRLDIKDGSVNLNLIGQTSISAILKWDSENNYTLYFEELVESNGLKAEDFKDYSKSTPIATIEDRNGELVFNWLGLYNRVTNKREYLNEDTDIKSGVYKAANN